jgi:Carboxypeptidase regulatory-like domain/PASTA domain
MQARTTTIACALVAALTVPSAAQAGSITGTVTDSVGGTPVEGVRVGAGPVGYGLRDYVETDQDGEYTIDGLEAGNFNVCFLPEPDTNLLRECWNNSPSPYGNAVSVPGGGSVGGIDAALEHGGIVEGTVTDAEGEPLEGICVSAWSPAGGGIGRTGDGVTDADGAYTVAGLTPGVAHKIVFAPWHTFYGHCPDGFGNDAHAEQWFDRRANFADADPLLLSADEVKTGIDGALGAELVGPHSPAPPAPSPSGPAFVPPPPGPVFGPSTTPAPVKQQCTVPALKKKTVAAARRLLSRARCKRGQSTRRYSRTVKRGRIVASKPKTGTVLPPRSKVDLVISKGPRP